MEQSSITAAGVIDTFLVLLIGIGPKIALVPFPADHRAAGPRDHPARGPKDAGHGGDGGLRPHRVGELLRSLLHFEVGSLSIAVA